MKTTTDVRTLTPEQRWALALKRGEQSAKREQRQARSPRLNAFVALVEKARAEG